MQAGARAVGAVFHAARGWCHVRHARAWAQAALLPQQPFPMGQRTCITSDTAPPVNMFCAWVAGRAGQAPGEGGLRRRLATAQLPNISRGGSAACAWHGGARQ